MSERRGEAAKASLVAAAQEAAPEGPASALLGRALALARAPEALWPELAALSSAAGGLDRGLGAWLGRGAERWARLELLYMAARFGEAGGRGERRLAGVFYTPPGVARWVAQAAVARRLKGEAVDLACGFGGLLAAALEAGGGGWTARGVDIDPWAVEVARARLWEGTGGRLGVAALVEGLVVGDGLAVEVALADAAVGNPPFGNGISLELGRSPEEDARWRAGFPEVAVGSYDLAYLFAARAAATLRPGGRYGLVLPQSALSVASGAGLRRWLAAEAPPDALWAPREARLFPSADVRVALLSGARSAPPGGAVRVSAAAPGARGGPEGGLKAAGALPADGASWAELLSAERGLLATLEAPVWPLVPLGEAATIFGGAATGTAYNLLPRLEEAPEGPGCCLVTTGLIDRYASRWGERPCRYLRSSWAAPRWPALPAAEADDDDVDRAHRRQRCPKLLVAGLSQVLEAVADPDGALGGAVSTWIVTAPGLTAAELALLEGALNAPALSLLYMTRFSGKALSGGNTTVGRRELGQLPLWSDWRQLATAEPSPAWEAASPWALDPAAPQARRALASLLLGALAGRAAGVAPARAADEAAAAAASRLYGFDAAGHAAIMDWFRRRCATMRRADERLGMEGAGDGEEQR